MIFPSSFYFYAFFDSDTWQECLLGDTKWRRNLSNRKMEKYKKYDAEVLVRLKMLNLIIPNLSSYVYVAC